MLNKINIPVTSSQCVIHNCFKSSLHLHNNNKDIFYLRDNAFKKICHNIINNKNNNNDDVFLNMLIKSNEKTRSKYFIPRILRY